MFAEDRSILEIRMIGRKRFGKFFDSDGNIVYLPNPSAMSRMWHKVNLLSGVQLVWIYRFTSPRLVAIPRLKNAVCLLIHCREEHVDLCLSEGHLYKVKRKNPRPRIELQSPIPFLTTITVSACVVPSTGAFILL